MLEEAAGQRDDAIASYRLVVQQAPPYNSLSEAASVANKRLSLLPYDPRGLWYFETPELTRRLRFALSPERSGVCLGAALISV